LIEQPLSRQNPLRVLRECQQQIELPPESTTRVFVGGSDSRGVTSAPIREAQCRPRVGDVATVPRRRPAQHRLDACQQFALIERFCKVVIRADLESNDTIVCSPMA